MKNNFHVTPARWNIFPDTIADKILCMNHRVSKTQADDGAILYFNKDREE